MNNLTIEAAIKGLGESVKSLEKTLLQIRDEQVRRLVAQDELDRAQRAVDQARAEASKLPVSYLDFRQPRRDGDSYHDMAYPGSPNAEGKPWRLRGE